MTRANRPTWKRVRTAASAGLAGLVLAVTLVSVTMLPVLSAWAQDPEQRWPAHFEVMAEPTSDRTIGEGAFFIPAWQDPNSLLFLDLRGVGDSKDNAEGQFGLAFRQLISESWIAGGYAFVDYRESGKTSNSFVSGVLGVEALSTNWDVRLNGYLPDDDQKSAPAGDAAVVEGGSLVIVNGTEQALWGLNGEVGWRLPFPGESIFWDTRVYVGGYWFDAPSGFGGDIAGPLGRFETRFHDIPYLPLGSRITVGAQIQWDDPRGTNGGGLISLRVPFYGYGGKPPSGATPEGRLARRMTDSIERDVAITTAVGETDPEPAINPKTGLEVGPVIRVSSTGEGDGSAKNPASLGNGIDLAGHDGIVVVLDAIEVPGNPALQPGQYLMGGGASAYVQRQSDGRIFPFSVKGTPGTLFREGTSDPVVIASRNNTISGLSILGGSVGIFAPEPRNLTVMDSYFEFSSENAIFVGGSEGLGSYHAISMNNTFVGEGKAIAAFSPQTGTGALWSTGDQFLGNDTGIAAFSGNAGPLPTNLEVWVSDALFENTRVAGIGVAGDFDGVGPAYLGYHVQNSVVRNAESGFQFAAVTIGDTGDPTNRRASLDVSIKNTEVQSIGSAVGVLGSGFDQIDLRVKHNSFTRWTPSDDGAPLDDFNAAVQVGSLEAFGGEGKSFANGNNLRVYVGDNSIAGYLSGVEVAAEFVTNVRVKAKDNAITGPDPALFDPSDSGIGVAVGLVDNLAVTAHRNQISGFGVGIAAGAFPVSDSDVDFGVRGATVEVTDNIIQAPAGDGKNGIEMLFEDSGGADFQIHDNQVSGDFVTGFGLDWDGPGGITLALTGNSFWRAPSLGFSAGVDIGINDVTNGPVDVHIANNLFDGYMNGVGVESNSQFFDNRFLVSNNRVFGSEMVGNGIFMNMSVLDGSVEASANDNEVSGFKTGIQMNFNVNSSDPTLAEANGNVIQQTGATALAVTNTGNTQAVLDVAGNAIDGANTGIELTGNATGLINLPGPDCANPANDNLVSNATTSFSAFDVTDTICVNGVNQPAF